MILLRIQVQLRPKHNDAVFLEHVPASQRSVSYLTEILSLIESLKTRNVNLYMTTVVEKNMNCSGKKSK